MMKYLYSKYNTFAIGIPAAKLSLVICLLKLSFHFCNLVATATNLLFGVKVQPSLVCRLMLVMFVSVTNMIMAIISEGLINHI